MQPELFATLSPTLNPAVEYESFSLPGGKIIKVKCSTWADGRKVYDLRSYGGGKPKSRDADKAKQLALEELARLQAQIGTTVEAVRSAFREVAPCKRPRVRNTRANNGFVIISPEPSDSDFYKPYDYKGGFSNCPVGVDAMIGPTHLEKRLFAHAFAKAKTHKVDRVSLNWVKTAEALAASPRGVSAAASQLRDRWRLFWFRSTQGSQLGATVRFLKSESIAPPSSELSSEEGEGRAAESSNQAAEQKQHTVPNSSEVCSRPLNKEKTLKDERTLGDMEWLEKIAHPQLSRWSVLQLRTQWRLHGIKAKRGGWTPGDREHFLKAWMPRAGEPPVAPEKISEPTWWPDYISECYPDARVRDFSSVRKSHPDIVDEGFRWAEANGRQDSRASSS